MINILRSIVMNYYKGNPVKLGGPGVIYQIDESLFVHKMKSGKEKEPSEEVWVFGIADSDYSPARGYMEIVPNREAETLLPIIERVCLPGTIIHSDEWAAYKRIKSELSFEHGTVNHSRHFVCPRTGVYTQTIESYWNKMKEHIKKMHGIGKEQLPGVIAELMFKDTFKEDTIIELMKLLKVE